MLFIIAKQYLIIIYKNQSHSKQKNMSNSSSSVDLFNLNEISSTLSVLEATSRMFQSEDHMEEIQQQAIYNAIKHADPLDQEEIQYQEHLNYLNRLKISIQNVMKKVKKYLVAYSKLVQTGKQTKAFQSDNYKRAQKNLQLSVLQLDKIFDDYSNYYLNHNGKKLRFFKIPIARLPKREKMFVQTIQSYGKFPFGMKLYYYRDQNQPGFCRMHPEIVRCSQFNLFNTNQVLQIYENNFITQLFQLLAEQSNVSHFQDCAIVLKSEPLKKCKGSDFQLEDQQPLIIKIECQAKKYLTFINQLMNQDKECSYCGKYLAYSVHQGLMLPPTEKVPQKLKGKQFKQVYTIMHLECLLQSNRERAKQYKYKVIGYNEDIVSLFQNFQHKNQMMSQSEQQIEESEQSSLNLMGKEFGSIFDNVWNI